MEATKQLKSKLRSAQLAIEGIMLGVALSYRKRATWIRQQSKVVDTVELWKNMDLVRSCSEAS